MQKSFYVLIVAGLLIFFLILLHFSQQNNYQLRKEKQEPLTISQKQYHNEPIIPLPLNIPGLDSDKVALGAKLFHDPRLSKDKTISCASCHGLGSGGVDRLVVSIGIGGAKGPINAPTVFNSGFNFRQFWDGRAASLEEQIEGPIHAPAEMGSDWPLITARLRNIPDYVRAFNKTYAGIISPANIKDAIATFERSLFTPNSPFDRYLRGDTDALSAAAEQGYQRFKSYGCVSCHQGVGIGGNMYQTFGVLGDYFADRGNITKADLGRFNLTGDPADQYVFKVPGLRNVALTAPYFHDGSAQTLEEAVEIMGRYQLGRLLSGEDIQLISAFLRSLTGEYQGEPL